MSATVGLNERDRWSKVELNMQPVCRAVQAARQMRVRIVRRTKAGRTHHVQRVTFSPLCFT